MCSVALDNHMGVAILRTRDLMDYSGVIAGEEEMDMFTAMAPAKSDLARVESGLSGEFYSVFLPRGSIIFYRMSFSLVACDAWRTALLALIKR